MAKPVVLVTGANRGLGKEVGLQLLEHGYEVFFGVRDPGKARTLSADLKNPSAHVVELDVTNETSLQRAIELIDERFGKLDALVNNAAISYDTQNSGSTVDLDFVRTAFETNVFGAWRTLQLALPLLKKSAHPRVVNVSSEGGSLASMGGGTPAYSTSKAALNAMTRVIAGEVRAYGILVNAICPGWSATDMGGRGGRPVKEGARSIVWGVTLRDDGPTGGFFRDGRPLPW